MWLKAPNITCTHGFSTRHGGVSQPPFHSLSLGGSEDSPTDIATNRRLALEALGLPIERLCTLKQVHGTTVCTAAIGSQEGDALVTTDPNLILAVSIADCYPILFYDEKNKVIAAAHAGWRGTAGKIAANVVQRMLQYGAEVNRIQVAIGQGISQDKFEVGPEVIARFDAEGFPENFRTSDKVDLVACNRWVLEQQGISGQNIWSMSRCTYGRDFFSYRRDKGVTGRMWGLISMQ